MRSGPSSSRSKSTAPPPKTAAATAGTTWPWTRNTAWSSVSSSASARRRTPANWSMSSGNGPTGGFINLMTSDEYPAYATAIAEVYAEPEVGAGGCRDRGRPSAGVAGVAGLCHGPQDTGTEPGGEGGGAVGVGTLAPWRRPCLVGGGGRVNTVFVERSNGSDRHRNSRKVGRRIGSPRTGEFMRP